MQHIVMTVATDLVHDNRVRREAETLAGAGYRVTVFSYIHPDDVGRLGWAGRDRPVAVPVPRAAWEQRRGLGRALPHTLDLFRWGGNAALLHAALACRADVYHAHDLDTLPVGAWLARRHHGRLVYDSHELFVDMIEIDPALPPLRQIKPRLARRSYARLEQGLIRSANAVITVGPAIAGEMAARYGIARPTTVLNCPRFQDMSAGSDHLRVRLGLGPDRRILLLQGSMLPGRGLVELVQSLPSLPPEYVLVFLGFNLGSYQQPIRAEIARLGLESRVFLLDALPADQLLQATASADLGIILLAGRNLNDRFALPNKLFEYMMAGLPFVATGWPEIAAVASGTGAGITIPAAEPDAIAAGVREALCDPARHRAMRQAALAAARGEYNWERQAGRLLELYAHLWPGRPALAGERP